MNLFAKLVTLYLLTTAINAQSLLGVTLYETKGERHIALEEFDFTTGKGTPYVQLDKDDGWIYSSASVVDEATNTIYLCLSDTLETGHLYAVKDGKVLLGLHGTKPYEGLDFANGTLYGYFNNQST
jgi:hypothetical protein